ncbi:MAG TPA: Asp-tRNA(Asn)/Glu-tRNA(Gln) amidotransferase subunit GatC [bacterium]|nr:Asp-tRNA(Asn)/Glu-tRNA(Gln) amidotransferase subunit GatC [bacterium]
MIDDRTVAQVARLSRLELSEEERERFRAQLGGILEHFQSLLALELPDEAPAAHAPEVANVLRDDTVRPSLPRDEVLANAPVSEDGYVVVPPVIEGE